jgi:hypothetical protein
MLRFTGLLKDVPAASKAVLHLREHARRLHAEGSRSDLGRLWIEWRHARQEDEAVGAARSSRRELTRGTTCRTGYRFIDFCLLSCISSRDFFNTCTFFAFITP